MSEESHIENSDRFPGLNVQKGIDQQSSLNPDAIKKIKGFKKQIDVNELFEGILNRDINSLSKAITLIESSLPAHNLMASEIIERCISYTGNSVRIGITGVPGAGKSSFIETLGLYLTDRGHNLAVLAIDPSSERSKGSILGDKTRMEELSCRKNAFIRPSPSGGTLGGVARKTREVVYLCEAAGFDTIFIETVGVGQSETVVNSMVDYYLLLMIAGAGDELQGIKRGIMELVDGIAINKADGDNINRANIAKSEYQNALHLFPMPDSGILPNVNTCSSINGSGIEEIWESIFGHIEKTKESGYFDVRRNNQSKYWMYESINEVLMTNFYNNKEIKEMLIKFEKDVTEKKISSFYAGQTLLNRYFKKK